MKTSESYGERRMRAEAADPKGKPLPHDVMLERSILCDLLEQPTGAVAYETVKDLLVLEDFFVPENAVVYEAVTDIYKRRAIDGDKSIVGLVEVAQWLRLRVSGDIQDSVIVPRLPEALARALADATKLQTHFDQYTAASVAERRIEPRARALHEMGEIRRAVSRLWTVAALGYNGDRELFKDGLQSLARIAIEIAAPARTDTEPLIEPVKRIFSKYLGMEPPPPVQSTGFPGLDPFVALDPQSLLVVGARSGRGKSSVAMQLALHAGRAHGPAIYISTEMPSEQLALRAACTLARVDAARVRRGLVSIEESSRLIDASHLINQSMTWITDKPGLDVAQISAIAHREAARLKREGQKPPSVLVVDYLQRIRVGRMAPHGSNREQQVAAMATAFKELARELNLCVVLPAQLNADGDGRSDERPRSSDLRESKAIENEADYVLLIHNPEYNLRDERDEKDRELPEACEFIVAKNRLGAKANVHVWFQPKFTRFSSMTEQEQQHVIDGRTKSDVKSVRSIGGRR